MLLRVRLLHIALGHLLHHKVPIDLDIFNQHPVLNTPLAGDGKNTNGGFGVDERVDACGDVGEGEFVCCLMIQVSLAFLQLATSTDVPLGGSLSPRTRRVPHVADHNPDGLVNCLCDWCIAHCL